jgi:hypothetical protein
MSDLLAHAITSSWSVADAGANPHPLAPTPVRPAPPRAARRPRWFRRRQRPEPAPSPAASWLSLRRTLAHH